MKKTHETQPNTTLMLIGAVGVIIPCYATMFNVMNGEMAMLMLIPSTIIFASAFLLKK